MKPYFLCALHPTKPLSLRATPEGEIRLVDWHERRVVDHWSAGPTVAVTHGATLHSDAVKVHNGPSFPFQQGTNLIQAGDLLWVGRPGSLTALDPATGAVKHELLEDKFQNPALLAAHDDTLAWSAMGASEILVIQNGQIKTRIESVGEVYALAIHPDGARLAASVTGAGNTVMQAVQIFKLESGLPERKFSIPFQALAVAISPDGSWVVTGDSMGAQLWDYARGGPERRFALRETAAIEGLGQVERPRAGLVTAVRFDGEHVVTDGHELAVWSLATGERLWALEVTGV
jgi:hypothetical protein